MKSLQEAYNSIYIQEEFIETVDVFECAYITLVENGMSEDDATEVVNYIYEHLDEIQELEQNLQEDLTENIAGKVGMTLLGGALKMLNMLPKKKGVQRLLNMPKPKLPSQLPTMQSVVKKTTGTPVQGRLLTKKGTAQNFTGGRTPFAGTDPVPAPSSKLPQPKKLPAQAPGQMRIPGMSDTAQTLSRITGKPMGPGGMGISVSGSIKGLPRRAPKPEFGPNAVKSTPYKTSKPELRPGGQTPKPEFKVTQSAKPAYSVPKKDILTPSQMKAQRTADKVRALKISGGIGVVGGTAALVDKANKDSDVRRAELTLRQQQRDAKLAQQRAETQAASQPKTQQTGERSAKANQEKQEKAKAKAAEKVRRSKDQLSAAAKDFDKAFASARKAGESEFTWRGKRYNTKLKGE